MSTNLTDVLLNMPGPGEAEPIIALPEPRATGPSSQIDPTLPVYGNPTTASVRQNFATAQVEISGLMQATQGAPFLALAGGKMGGPMYLYNDPTDVMMPVSLGYFNAHGGGGSGGGGIPEAPSDGAFYLRSQGAWVPGVALSGGTTCQMTGEFLLAANPADALGAVPKQYADAISTVANAAVKRGGDIMTGLLTLSGDPTAPLGAVTKQYTDAGLALKAPINNPTFTGIVNTAGRIIATAAAGPSLTLYDTTTGAPCFGSYNSGGYLSWGLMTPSTGNPNGAPFATMDQSGNFLFATRVNVTGGRLISSLASNSPSITLNNTSQSHIYGFWNTGFLCFGICDATGAPQTQLGYFDQTGGLTLTGSFSTAGGVYVGGAGLISASSSQVTISTTTGANLANLNLYATDIISYGTQLLVGQGQSAAYIILYDSSGLYSDANFHIWSPSGTPTSGSSWRWMYQKSSGYLSWYNYAQVLLLQIQASGNLAIAGTLSQGSDARLKENITDVPDVGLDVVRRLIPKRFDRLPPKEPPPPEMTLPPPRKGEIGFVAQDVREVLPAAVTTNTDGDLGVELMPLIAALVNAMKEVDTRLSSLEGARR